ncbi:unnamed protein product [Allacma fusca]|uniref:SWIM-type domain-containing protein n=1 Tax=Allacma fusca TaxID=39272 RepID=A0A8J2JHU6_9HEXA|nr:unnamed protein product [Allacma fusca]
MIVRTVGRSNNVCCVCGENGLPKQTVTNTLAACVWASDSILVHPKNRTCQIHVQGRRFTDAALELLRRRSSPKEKNQCEMFAHLNDFLTATDGEYHFHIHRELPNLIRVKMASRYRSGTIHSLWIQYRPGGEGHGSITGWYCRCQSGARTLGCCAHIVSVIWYFGIGRHLQNLKYPAENIAANLLDVRTRRQI